MPYQIRRAELGDVPFLAKAIVSAEKGGTDKLSFSTLFNLDEKDVISLIQEMILKGMKGCDFSIENFLIATYNNEPIASVTGWIEGHEVEQSSSIIKSNLIGFTFPLEAIKSISKNMPILKDFIIDRESKVLQIEHVYVDPDHRGHRLSLKLINKHIEDASQKFESLSKVHLQVYQNNNSAIKAYERQGFKIAKEVTSTAENTLDYLPYHIKLLLEKKIGGMNKSEIHEKLKITLFKVLEHENFELVDENVTTDIEGWTSLTHMIIVREIEIAFEVSFDLEDYNKIKTIGSLTDLIQSKLN